MTRFTARLAAAMASALAISCAGPGHRAAFDQFEVPHSGRVMAVQGYVDVDDGVALRESWLELIDIMAEKPGFIRAELSPGIGPESGLWLSIAYWRSLDDLRSAFADARVLEAEHAMPEQQFVHLFWPNCSHSAGQRRCP